MLHDLRHAARGLLRSPGFTTIAVLTLALGIGANTAIISLARAVFSSPLPFPHADRLVKLFDVRTRSIDVNASTLSGGNQQKLILARELDPDPDLMVAAQPTRGLDVGAIEFVWKQILDQKAAGRAVLLISAELDEIYALSDRIVTLYEGRITGEYPPDAPPEDVGVGMLGGATREVAS